MPWQRWRRSIPRARAGKKSAPGVIDELLSANPLHLGVWVEALRPVRQKLLKPLATVFRDPKRPEQKQVAAQVLAGYAADRPEVLAELLLDADARQYAVISPVLMKHSEQATTRMRQELATRPDYWKNAPLDPVWQEPAPELVREVEQAGGLIAERFALCQALPLERVQAVTEGLRAAGYRPVRVRPWEHETVNKKEVRAAVVWTRDGIAWTLRTGLTAAQVKAAPAGMIPCDVAAYATKDGDRYAALWRKPGKGEQAVVYTGVPEPDHKAATDRFKADGYLPATLQGLAGANGMVRYSGVWWKGLDKPETWNLRWADAEQEYDDAVFSGEQLLLDVYCGRAFASAGQLAWVAGLIASPRSIAALALPSRYREIVQMTVAPRHYASVWRDDTTREAVGLHGLSADAHLARCRELAEKGYRPVALSLLPGEKTPLAASVWHRPVPTAAETERLASRQGTAAATLLHLKQPGEVWPLLQHSPDPTVRSFLVERVGSRGVDPRLLVERLEHEQNVSARRALLVALGDYRDNDLPASVRGPLGKKLLAWYRDDPDAGIHGAIDWLLRHGKEGPLPRPQDWGQAKELERIDKELAGQPDAPARDAAPPHKPDAPARTAPLVRQLPRPNLHANPRPGFLPHGLALVGARPHPQHRKAASPHHRPLFRDRHQAGHRGAVAAIPQRPPRCAEGFLQALQSGAGRADDSGIVVHGGAILQLAKR